jgi:hypothetical protein
MQRVKTKIRLEACFYLNREFSKEREKESKEPK